LTPPLETRALFDLSSELDDRAHIHTIVTRTNGAILLCLTTRRYLNPPNASIVGRDPNPQPVLRTADRSIRVRRLGHVRIRGIDSAIPWLDEERTAGDPPDDEAAQDQPYR
jgi:hypothetical protein